MTDSPLIESAFAAFREKYRERKHAPTYKEAWAEAWRARDPEIAERDATIESLRAANGKLRHGAIEIAAKAERALQENADAACARITDIANERDEALATIERARRERDAHVADLAQCYRLSGADTDGDEDWRIAPYAVTEVRRLREDYDRVSDEIVKCGEGDDHASPALLAELSSAKKKIEEMESRIARLRIAARAYAPKGWQAKNADVMTETSNGE